jgi:hypothetical protein
MKSLLFALAIGFAALFAYTPSQAGQALDDALGTHCARTCIISNNAGGDVAIFQLAAQEVVDEGKHLRIVGFCASACVILMDMARDNTCITQDAQIAVHKALIIRVTGKTIVDGREVPTGRLLRREDPADSDDINAWVYAHGGYPTKGVMMIPVKEARRFWRMC